MARFRYDYVTGVCRGLAASLIDMCLTRNFSLCSIFPLVNYGTCRGRLTEHSALTTGLKHSSYHGC